MKTILLADDHKLFIEGLKTFLELNDQYQIVGKLKNGDEVISFLQQSIPDVLIMDINMPQKNGYDTMLWIKHHCPDLPVIIVSMLSESASVSKMLEAGAKAYIFKNAGEDELTSAIEAVTIGEYFVNPQLEPILKTFLKKKKDIEKGYIKETEYILTDREQEILKLIVKGYTSTEIAETIFLSNRTVEVHRKNIMTKLGTKNTASLVKYALENHSFLGIDSNID